MLGKFLSLLARARGLLSASLVLQRLQADKEGLAETAIQTLRAFTQITSILKMLTFFLRAGHRIGLFK